MTDGAKMSLAAIPVLILGYEFVQKDSIQPSANTDIANEGGDKGSNDTGKHAPEPVKKTPAPKPEAKTKKDERLLWEFETGAEVLSSPAIGSDGRVYVGSYANKLYAIKTDSKVLAKSPWPMGGQNPLHTGRVMKK
jgi:outer membrane protein assembly factor BamB